MALSFLLVGQDLAEGDTGVVVDANVQILPADAASVALAGAVAGDAVAWAVEAAELLDIDVDEFAGVLAFVAPHRLGRFERLEAVEPEAPQDTADGRGGDPDLGRDLRAAPTLPAERGDLLDHWRRGRPAQSVRSRRAVLQAFAPLGPEARDPFAHGASFAFLWTFIRGSHLGSLTGFVTHQLPRFRPGWTTY